LGLFAAAAALAERIVTTLNGILETAVYVDDMARARHFYEEVMGLQPMFEDRRLTAYNVAGRSVLLVFQRGASLEPAVLPGGTIPPHDGAGPSHLAFAAGADQLGAWEEKLKAHGVEIEGRTDWPRGGKSIYFRDPDGHLIELATPGLWPIY
jgi:catechol 2,3-dioxygenase-like lactoylglutathione lyase family enzyme